MKKILFPLACWAVLAPGALSEDVSPAPAENPRPNILIILADDMGYGDVGVLEPDGRIPTPHLDRLAGEGLVFTDAHAAGSYCVPSRYGLLTGRYMWRTRLGSGGNLSNFGGALIAPGRRTIADLLREAGYFTGIVGKWHQGIDWALHDESARDIIRDHRNYQDFGNIDFASPVRRGPTDYGFDSFFGIAGSAEMNPATFLENDRVSFSPALTGEAEPDSFRESIVHNRSDGAFAIRKGAFKLTVEGPETTEQLLDDAVPASLQLHDLGEDIGETTDVSADHPDRVEEMHARLKEVVRESGGDAGR